jgi:hypothetical protein
MVKIFRRDRTVWFFKAALASCAFFAFRASGPAVVERVGFEPT